MAKQRKNVIDVRLTVPKEILELMRAERCSSADGRSFDLILLRRGRSARQFSASLQGSGPTVAREAHAAQHSDEQSSEELS